MARDSRVNVAVYECKALDVHSRDTGERLGYVIETGDRKAPWVAIAILPTGASDMLLGTFRNPNKAVRALVENETAQYTLGSSRG